MGILRKYNEFLESPEMQAMGLADGEEHIFDIDDEYDN